MIFGSRASTLRGALACAALLLPPPHHPSQQWQHASAFAQGSTAPEADAFKAAKELGTVEAWDAFLQNYPSGFHADLARAYVKKLAAPSTPAPTSAPVEPTSSVSPPARELPCKDALKVKSQDSNSPAKIRFINASDSTLVIQWIDFNGSLKEYGELKPGAELLQDTFVTHPWIAAYAEGSCRQLFMPIPGTSIARLLPESEVKDAMHDEPVDHGPTPMQSCKDSGMDYDGTQCVKRKQPAAQPSKATIERRAKQSCIEIGMIYLNGQCAPKKKSQRDNAQKKINKACPAGMYRNPYGQCQPNETGG